MAIIVTALFLGVIMAGLAARADASTPPPNLDRIYQETAEQYGEDWRLLKAFARVESSENPKAVNLNDPSYGLFQIQAFWLFHFGLIDERAYPDQVRDYLIDPVRATDCACRILQYFRKRTNPHTLAPFKFPSEADIYNVGETLWAKGRRNLSYRDRVKNEYQRLTAL